MSDELYDVAIVGFGPSGAIAAALLGQAGLRVHVCDRDHEVYDKPRAIALDHEIFRIFQGLGLLSELEAHSEPFTDSCYYGVDGELIRRMTMVDEPYPQAHVPSSVFSQPAVEAVLRKHVATLPSVDVETGLTVTALRQSHNHAVLTLADDTGGEKLIQSRYVIGCDGASSTVRRLQGLPLEDLGFDEPWLVVDVLINEKGQAKLPETSVQYCEPERPCTFVIGPGNHRRWEISLKENEDPCHAATPEGTWELLKRWITSEDAELWRQATYRFHALVAKRWRSDRVFIAGDAAHQQPPFLGQGMCQGVRDVTNLCWKLRTVLTTPMSPQAADRLLDSYGEERYRHVRELTSVIKSAGAVICERDPERARERDQRLLAENDGKVKPTPRQDVMPRLSTGLIADTPAAGTLFPQPWVQQSGQRHRLDDVIGGGWRLITEADFHGKASPSLIKKTGISVFHLNDNGIEDTNHVLPAWFERYGIKAALVRPDNYVYGTAANDAELQRLQEQLEVFLD